MTRRLLIVASTVLFAVLAIALLVWGLGKDELDTSQVRFVQAVSFLSPVDVEIDGTRVYTDVAYGGVTSYTVLSAGTHTVTVHAGARTLVEVVELTGGIDATVIGVGGSYWSLHTVALADDNRSPNADTVRVVHVSPYRGMIDVTISGAAATRVVEDLGYGEPSDYLSGLGAGSIALQVSAAGEAIPLTPSSATLKSNAITTLFVMGQEPPLDLVVSVDRRFTSHQLFLPFMVAGDR